MRLAASFHKRNEPAPFSWTDADVSEQEHRQVACAANIILPAQWACQQTQRLKHYMQKLRYTLAIY